MSKTKKEFLDNLNVDYRLMGTELHQFPFAQHAASARTMMASNHLNQALSISGNDYPKTSTGFETRLGDYEFSTVRRDMSGVIIAAIPKFEINVGVNPIKENASTTYILRGDDGTIDYFDVSEYTKGSSGYGWYNHKFNTHYLSVGNYLDKDDEFMSSPQKKGNFYNMGVNANIAFMTKASSTEDAFTVRRGFAEKKLTSKAIETIGFYVNPYQLLINTYGDESEIKFFPDLGEVVRSDGILACLRTPTKESFITDMMYTALSTPNVVHDDVFAAPAGAVVLDVDVYINKRRGNKVSQEVFGQIWKYQEQHIRYARRVLDEYRKLRDEPSTPYTFSDRFTTLVTRCMERLSADGMSLPELESKRRIRLKKKRMNIDFVYVDITYMYDQKTTAGSKFSGRDGGKGVATIEEDANMPVDDYGRVADIVVCSFAIISRMIPSQAYEQFFNYASFHVEQKIRGITDYEEAYALAYEYIKDINPNYAEMVIAECCKTPEDRIEFVDTIRKCGIYLVIPPYLNGIGPELVMEIKDKYNVVPTPVEFNITDINGNVIKRVRTKDPVIIAEKYTYKLYKMATCHAPGVGFVNQLYIPVKPSGVAKFKTNISMTPLRLGEDEQRNLVMIVGPYVAARLMGLYANSVEGVNEMIYTLLTCKNPTKLSRLQISTRRLIENNRVINTAQHMFATAGVDIVNTVMNKKEAAAVLKQLPTEMDTLSPKQKKALSKAKV